MSIRTRTLTAAAVTIMTMSASASAAAAPSTPTPMSSPAPPASRPALAGGNVYQAYQTSWCITHREWGGTRYRVDLSQCDDGIWQQWGVAFTGDYVQLLNTATGAALDSNRAGEVYALSPNGGDYQKWAVVYKWDGNIRCFQNAATKRYLNVMFREGSLSTGWSDCGAGQYGTNYFLKR